MHDRVVFWGLLAFCSVAFVVAVVIGTDPSWDWGDVPTWVSAITTLGALIAAGVLLTVELGRDRRFQAADAERRDKEAAIETERREREASSHQADLVAAWCGPTDDFRDHRLFFGNGSQLPIYDVVVTWRLPDGGVIHQEPYNLIAPGRTVDGIPDEVLDANRDRFADLNHWEFCRQLKVGIRFRDTAGRTWERNENGILEQLGVTVFVKAADPVRISGLDAVVPTSPERDVD